MPKAKVNGVEIYYETHGEGPAVVFAHGRAGSHLSWWRQVPAFRDRYRCITFDARGWGASTSQPGVNRRAAFGEDLKQLLDFLEEPEVLPGLPVNGRVDLHGLRVGASSTLPWFGGLATPPAVWETPRCWKSSRMCFRRRTDRPERCVQGLSPTTRNWFFCTPR